MRNALHQRIVLAALSIPLLSVPTFAQDRTPCDSAQCAAALSQAALSAFAEQVQRFVVDGRIVGAELLVIEHHRTVLHRVYGWNDRERGRPMEPNTIFNIRSMTKPLIGAGIQILLDRGRLRLTDRVADFLPAFQHGGLSEITVAHLLTHRSGFPANGVAGLGDQYANLRAAIHAVAERGPQFDPGSRFWYSDANADVLAALIEIVSGEPLDVFLDAQLFRPLGMRDTGFLTQASPNALPRERTAVLYGGTRGAWLRFWSPDERPLYRFPMGSQSVYSTPRDYAQFLSLWLDSGRVSGRRILTPEAVERMLAPAAPMTQIGSAAPYPTGFPDLEPWHGQMALAYRDRVGGNASRVHAVGYAGSDGTYAWGWPDRDVMVLFFSHSRGQDIHRELEARLHELLSEAAPTADANLTALGELHRYVGRYRADFGAFDGVEFNVVLPDAVLAVEVPGQGVFRLREPDSQGWRSFAVTDLVAVSFDEDSLGHVRSMIIRQTTVLPRQGAPSATDVSVPGPLLAVLGDYTLPGRQGALTITWRDGDLMLRDPAGAQFVLGDADADGYWHLSGSGRRRLAFIRNAEGAVVSMRLEETESLPRVPLSPDGSFRPSQRRRD